MWKPRTIGRLACALLLSSVLGCHPSSADICRKVCQRITQCANGTSADEMACEIRANCANLENNPNHCSTDSFNASVDCDNACLNEDSCGALLPCLLGCGGCAKIQ